MEILKCNLCAGSPEIERYEIKTDYKDIKTDICIGKEIEFLINRGIVTYGCCCGHGEREPSCLVDVKSREWLKDLGYELHEYSKNHSKQGIGVIYLKTNVQCELRKILERKIFRYLEKGGNDGKGHCTWTS